MVDHPKPSAAALVAADAICKRHGMLTGGYMRDSLAEALEAYALERGRSWAAQIQAWPSRMVYGPGVEDETRISIEAALTSLKLEIAAHLRGQPFAEMLGVPITDEERRAISKDGP